MPSTELTHYDAARRELDAANRIDEVKNIRDKALAMQAYARQAKDKAMIEWATGIRRRAEEKAGEMLWEMEKRGERHKGHGDQKSESRHVTPKLADLGITKNQSSRWQRMAGKPPKNKKKKQGTRVYVEGRKATQQEEEDIFGATRVMANPLVGAWDGSNKQQRLDFVRLYFGELSRMIKECQNGKKVEAKTV
jgi:hypothetical protein